jgi:hypothetical protein
MLAVPRPHDALQYPAECSVDVRTGAPLLDDTAAGSGRELLNTENRIFNSGSERDGIAEISCDTIAVVAMSSSTLPPNHVIFNLGAANVQLSRFTFDLHIFFIFSFLQISRSFELYVALVDMVGPIPKVGAVCRTCHPHPSQTSSHRIM